MNVYRVRDWDVHFELAQGRKVKDLSWVPVPLKHDGLGFRRLMARRDGVELYGAWVLIVQIAAKCRTRGTLADERGPFGSQELSLKTGCPAEVFDRALQTLCSQDIGWVESVDYQRATSALHIEESREEETRREESRGESAQNGLHPDLLSWVSWWNRLHQEGLVPAGVDPIKPAKSVVDNWTSSRKSSEMREILADRDALETMIRRSDFCREPWFTLSKLLHGKNRTKEWIAQRLLEGGYVDRQRKVFEPGPGQRHSAAGLGAV